MLTDMNLYSASTSICMTGESEFCFPMSETYYDHMLSFYGSKEMCDIPSVLEYGIFGHPVLWSGGANLTLFLAFFNDGLPYLHGEFMYA